MSLMDKKILRCFILIVALVMIVTLTSCNKVTKSNYDKIYIGMKKSEVIQIIGLPDETIPQLTYDICYWYDNATSFKDAIEKEKEGKEVYCIILTFTIDEGIPSVVTHKEYGRIQDFKGE